VPLVRAFLAVLILPGTMGFLIPLAAIERAWPERPMWSGLAIVATGSVLLGWCVREFLVVGRGTLAPWWPPARFVTTGPFAYSRNPIYVAMLVIIAGWAVVYGSQAIAIYGVVMFVLFHIRTLAGEEPTLAGAFGREWDEYRRRVPRWLAFRTGSP
jgi:protein-S-isoprenylcysteine O-methyltransferase Ste14